MTKTAILLIVSIITFAQTVNAQKNEIYLRSNLIDLSNNQSDYSNIDQFNSNTRIRKTTDITIGYTQIKKNNMQYSIGLRMGKYTTNTETTRTSDAMDIEFINQYKGSSAGLEVGIGKRLDYNQLLFIPNVSLNFYHSLAGYSEEEITTHNKISNIKSHEITDAVGGSNVAIISTISQGVYYKLGAHWKLGMDIFAQMGYTKYYGKTIQTTRDIINNNLVRQSMNNTNDKRFYLSSGIQFGIRYTL